jgi:hypothetical protein
MFEGEDLLLLNGVTPTKFAINVAIKLYGDGPKKMVLSNEPIRRYGSEYRQNANIGRNF